MPTPEELIADLEQAGEAFARFIEAQPAETLRRRPGAEEWSAAQLAGHVAELLPYWSEQARRVAEQPGYSLGRDADDPGRLAGVASLDDASPDVAAAAVRDAIRRAVSALRSIPTEGWRARGRHRSGDMTPADVVQRFIVAHIPEHLDQARAAASV